MAGGTGGHVMPALAVAEALRGEGWRVVWLGTHAGMEAKLVPAKGFDMAWVKVAGVRGKGLLTKLLLPFNLLHAFWQSARAIFRERPDVALGLGGYVAFPGGMMAVLLNKPLVIHEQNAVAGLTNKILAHIADRVLLGLPLQEQGARGKGQGAMASGEWVGNPVRPEIGALAAPAQRLAGREGPLRLLVIGGSLGAAALNEMIPRALALLPLEQRPVVRHQSGARHLEVLKRNYESAEVAVEPLAFIDDMAEAYAWADVVICRAGALTVAEIAAAGLPALFVPFPFAVDDHQTANAAFLADQGAAWSMQQKTLSPEKLAEWLSGLTRADLLARAQKARALAKPDATARVAQVLKELAK
ncbi:MAG: undecaprenyldiphospho-muramoylpentapeptide beta-N-acetylglucosaminyltransferase [Pseudomonadota bacterium]|nr:undecaprenyldiphospho-muramoylpentapeptide beta-N-acetylglucosaminyltransferase [Pseudomonadota bacterium]MDP1905802.1 undecaprenyldiphospho-muramoylpentapeptide beta-N-acetylglucosaminyltransferase [Pseudomonadota bacterium]MDP2354032.1 undecaprenyldiphospho-muramoylpentapeptide beta-N-acetylglucosaminyltransferase [Pseudomonadota bacterium]